MTRRLSADFSLALCSLLWGATFVVVKNALDHASVFVFLAVRFSVAAVLMLAWSTRALRRFEREDLFAGLRLGCFMFLGYAFQTAGLQYTTPAKSGFVTGSSVVLVPLLLALFWGPFDVESVRFGNPPQGPDALLGGIPSDVPSNYNGGSHFTAGVSQFPSMI
jgi:drug/metabolite transporter (DMT)-like permease